MPLQSGLSLISCFSFCFRVWWSLKAVFELRCGAKNPILSPLENGVLGFASVQPATNQLSILVWWHAVHQRSTAFYRWSVGSSIKNNGEKKEQTHFANHKLCPQTSPELFLGFLFGPNVKTKRYQTTVELINRQQIIRSHANDPHVNK